MAIMFLSFPMLSSIPSQIMHMKCQHAKPNRAFIPFHLRLRLELLLDLAAVLYALKNVLTVLIELQLRDHNLRGVNADGDGLTG